MRLAVAAAVWLASSYALADTTGSPIGPEEALSTKIAVWRFDALGIEAELVNRLETLFRMELDRLVKVPLPTRRDVDRTLTTPELRDCGGEDKCLTAIGKKLAVDVVVTGTVGSLGDNYVLNIRAVDVASGKTLRQIASDPLRGSPDELIEGVREAAYRLLAPDQLLGAIQVQTDLIGAEVALDGKPLGRTPLPRLGVISKLALGKHKLRVSARDYAPFDEDVTVRFQKISPVVVRLIADGSVAPSGRSQTIERRPLYSRTWFIIATGVTAIAIGAAVGYTLGHLPCTNAVTQGGC